MPRGKSRAKSRRGKSRARSKSKGRPIQVVVKKARSRRPTRSRRNRKAAGQAAAPAAPAGVGGLAVMQEVEAKKVSDTEMCYFQSLYPGKAIEKGALTPPPVPDVAPYYMLGTKTQLDLTAIQWGASTSAGMRIIVTPAPQGHINYATVMDANGAATTLASQNVDGYSEFAAHFDDIRCASMDIKVKYMSRDDALNGNVVGYNFNPVGALLANVAGLQRGQVLDLTHSDVPALKAHFLQQSWAPLNPEHDFAIRAPTGFTESTDTALVVDVFCSNADKATVSIEVEAVWAIRLLVTDELIGGARTFSIDPATVGALVAADLLGAGRYSTDRVARPDDGEWAIAAKAARNIWGDVKDTYGNAKGIFAPGRTLAQRGMSFLNTFKSLGSVWSGLSSFFGSEEAMYRALVACDQKQLDMIVELVKKDGRLDWAYIHDMVAFLSQQRKQVRRPTLLDPRERNVDRPFAGAEARQPTAAQVPGKWQLLGDASRR